MLTKAEVAEWKSNDITQKVLQEFQKEIDRHLAILGEGGYIGDSPEQTGMNAIKISSVMRGLSFIFDIEGEDPNE